MSTQNANSVAITGGSISGTTVSGYIPTTEKGSSIGVATLDAGGKVPVSQLPAAVFRGHLAIKEHGMHRLIRLPLLLLLVLKVITMWLALLAILTLTALLIGLWAIGQF
jgi:hypothetical protein